MIPFSPDNRKSAISSNPKSTQKQNESTFLYIPTENTIIIHFLETPKQIVKIVTKNSLNPITTSTKLQSPIIENQSKINTVVEIKKQTSIKTNEPLPIEKEKSAYAEILMEEEVKNSMIYKELSLKNSALKEQLKTLGEVKKKLKKLIVPFGFFKIDRQKTDEIMALIEEIEKERAEKKKLQERNVIMQKQIDDLKEELSFYLFFKKN